MLPLVHDFAGETVLVFGGGPVGARRARWFVREARVVVVSPAFADESFGDAERVRAAPTPADVDGWVERVAPALVVAATDDPAVNDAVERAARAAGTLVNRADRRGDRPADDVVVPAIVREDPVVVSISTGGADPAVSRELRRRIGGELDGAGAVAGATAAVRAALDRREVDGAVRREALRAVAGSEVVWTAARQVGERDPADGDRRSVFEAAVRVAEDVFADADVEVSLDDVRRSARFDGPSDG